MKNKIFIFIASLFLFSNLAYAKVVFNPFTGKQDFTGVNSISGDITTTVCSNGSSPVAGTNIEFNGSIWDCGTDSTGSAGNLFTVSEDGTNVASADTLNFTTGLDAIDLGNNDIAISADRATTTAVGVASFDTNKFSVTPLGGVSIRNGGINLSTDVTGIISSDALDAAGQHDWIQFNGAGILAADNGFRVNTSTDSLFISGDVSILGDNINATTNTDRAVFMGNGATYVIEKIDLGTDTDGNYQAGISEGTYIDVTSGTGEGATGSIAVDLTESTNISFSDGSVNSISWDVNIINAASPDTVITFTDGLMDINNHLRTGRAGLDGQFEIFSEQGASDFLVTLKPNASMTQDTSYTLPANDGDSGQVLQTDGSGALTWAADSTSGGGSVRVSNDSSHLVSADTINFTTGMTATTTGTIAIVSNDIATTVAVGVASFDTNNFTVVQSGGVTLKTVGVGTGGTGLTSISNDAILIGNNGGTGFDQPAIPNCADSGGNHLNYNSTTNSFTCGTTGDGTGGAGSTVVSEDGTFLVSADTINFGRAITATSPASGKALVSADIATATTFGVASFDSTNFTVTAGGKVSLRDGGVGSLSTVSEDGSNVVASADTLNFTNGIDAIANGSKVTISNDVATTTTLGIVSFDTNVFTVRADGGASTQAFTGDVTTSAGSFSTTIGANTVALTTDTTGNYAAGDAEAGNALTGDSATAFFSTGTLEIGIGGTGVTSISNDAVLVGNNGGTGFDKPALPNCTDSGGQHLNYTAVTNSFSCGTTGDGTSGGGSIRVSNDSAHLVSADTINFTTGMTVTASGTIATISADAASTSALGVASFDSTNFLVNGLGGVSIKNGGVSNTAKVISQTAHGLSAGNVIKFNGASYDKAIANSSASAEVVGVVNAVTDANTFVVLTEGYTTGLSGLSAGSVYFLSPTSAGALTATEPSTAGQISKPLVIADSTTTGYFYNFRGSVVGTSTPSAVIRVSEDSIDIASADTLNFVGINAANSSGKVTLTPKFNWRIPVQSAKLPLVNPAQIDGGNPSWRLLFDATTSERVSFDTVLNPYTGGTVSMDILYSMTSATSGAVTLGCFVECITSGDSTVVDAGSFDSFNSKDQSVPGTAGFMNQMGFPLTSFDSCAQGDRLRIMVSRDVLDARDTATGDTEIRNIRVYEV